LRLWKFFSCNSNYANELKRAITKTVRILIGEEENMSPALLTQISRIIENPDQIPPLDEMDKLRYDDSWYRIIRGANGINFRRLYMMPTVLLWASNAKIYEIESRLMKLSRATDDAVIETETRESYKIIRNYCIMIEYSSRFRDRKI